MSAWMIRNNGRAIEVAVHPYGNTDVHCIEETLAAGKCGSEDCRNPPLAAGESATAAFPPRNRLRLSGKMSRLVYGERFCITLRLQIPPYNKYCIYINVT